MEDPDLQVVGTIIVVDMAELSLLQQARLVSPSLAWHLTMVIQVRTANTQDLCSAKTLCLTIRILTAFGYKNNMAKISITAI